MDGKTKPAMPSGGRELRDRTVSRKLRFLVETHRMTVPALATEIGVRRSVLQEVIDGVSSASESLITKLASYFGVETGFIEGTEGTSAPTDNAPVVGSPASSAASKLPAPPLSLTTLAIRHQALIELLLEKGVIRADEYHAQVRKVEGRGRGAKRRRPAR